MAFRLDRPFRRICEYQTLAGGVAPESWLHSLQRHLLVSSPSDQSECLGNHTDIPFPVPCVNELEKWVVSASQRISATAETDSAETTFINKFCTVCKDIEYGQGYGQRRPQCFDEIPDCVVASAIQRCLNSGDIGRFDS